MTSRGEPGLLGSIDQPDALRAHVVSLERPPRLHGYDVEADLAQNYTVGEVALLALRGSPPTREEGRAFEVACVFISALPMTEGPTHAAMLARLCGASGAGVTATACVALAERAEREVADALPLFQAIERGDDPPVPVPCQAIDARDAESATQLCDAVGRLGWVCEYIPDGVGVVTAALGVFYQLGLHDPLQLVAAQCQARMPAVLAEAMGTKVGDFRAYPMDVPPVRWAGRGPDEFEAP
ncbi:MAG: hypothetical protein JRH11_24305 [Deltaproteobacteria bacterium]|nr:hypothetical protein [Deltaproteobacteria bacterium]